MKKFLTPGPGTHIISTGERATWEAAPKWVFGTSGRTDWTGGNVNPGPGEYNLDSGDADDQEVKDNKKSKSVKIGIKDSYGNGKKKHAFGYANRTENINKCSVPGPGSYQHKLVAKEPQKYSFGYKFGSKEFEVDNAMQIAPGMYNVNYTQQEFAKTNRFGKERKDNLYKT